MASVKAGDNGWDAPCQQLCRPGALVSCQAKSRASSWLTEEFLALLATAPLANVAVSNGPA